jgi:hypothetical protein
MVGAQAVTKIDEVAGRPGATQAVQALTYCSAIGCWLPEQAHLPFFWAISPGEARLNNQTTLAHGDDVL